MRTYGRIKARTLKPRQAGLMETLLPHLAVPEAGAIDVDALFSEPPPPTGRFAAGESRLSGIAERSRGGARVGGGGRSGALSLADLGAAERPHSVASGDTSPARGEEREVLVLEIGFGGGEHLVAQASAHPATRFIGVEPFLNGVASCLRHVEGANVSNVRIHNGDARDVIARLPDASLDLGYILFPDPWPKARHHKRRLIQAGFLGEFARVLKPGAEVRFATDWANYAEWTLEQFTRDARFVWTAERADDWRKPWPGHVTTRYEAKKLGDCAPIWLRFKLAG